MAFARGLWAVIYHGYTVPEECEKEGGEESGRQRSRKGESGRRGGRKKERFRLCICMYVCMCFHVCVCKYGFMCACMNICMYACVHACVCLHFLLPGQRHWHTSWQKFLQHRGCSRKHRDALRFPCLITSDSHAPLSALFASYDPGQWSDDIETKEVKAEMMVLKQTKRKPRRGVLRGGRGVRLLKLGGAY